MVSFIEFRMLEICKKCASQQGRVQKNAFCYISIKSQHKKIVDFSLEFVWKSINNEFSMNLQAAHFSKNVHTSLTGRPKCKNRWFYYGKTRFLQNFIPTEYGKHEKMLIFCWKYVLKLIFETPLERERQKKITGMTSNLVKIMISGHQK